jgi:hypothetical protein
MAILLCHFFLSLPKASWLRLMTKKVRRVMWYPTQAKGRLEWGTQPSLRV